MQQKSSHVKKMVFVAVMSAVAYLLVFIDFPILPLFPYLKIDFSDIPVLISMFLFGPVAGISTAFIRSLLHCVMTGLSVVNIIGDVAGFLASVVFTLPLYYFFNKKNFNLKNKILGVVTAVLSLTVFMTAANYFVLTPMYLAAAGQSFNMEMAKVILISILPFNLIKGTMISIAFWIVHLKLVPWLSKKAYSNQQNQAVYKNK